MQFLVYLQCLELRGTVQSDSSTRLLQCHANATDCEQHCEYTCTIMICSLIKPMAAYIYVYSFNMESFSIQLCIIHEWSNCTHPVAHVALNVGPHHTDCL